MNSSLRQRIFSTTEERLFDKLALEIFIYQSLNNPVYKAYIAALRIEPASVKSPQDIPFLPVSFFKEHKVLTGPDISQTVFESSGTTGTEKSRHYISDLSLYEMSFKTGFRQFYGEATDYFFAVLLPSNAGRENSSLIYMMNNLVLSSKHSESGFYNNDAAGLIKALKHARSNERKVIFLGVSFALLDLAEKFSPDLSGMIVIETGGMKGRRKEITRQELHSILKEGFNVETIHSEYGMTELLSQAWSMGDGLFYCPPWMKIFIRDPLDPLTIFKEPGKNGGINVIDLANINSCSFLAVNDIGKLHDDGGFEVLGRFDNSEIRGCNLMVE
jgi:phenylacetate-coenzyme A ligase PaaK-like adenylate-forming protein